MAVQPPIVAPWLDLNFGSVCGDFAVGASDFVFRDDNMTHVAEIDRIVEPAVIVAWTWRRFFFLLLLMLSRRMGCSTAYVSAGSFALLGNAVRLMRTLLRASRIPGSKAEG